MSNNWTNDEHKVMDVNHPGKGRIMTGSSRPVAAPLVDGDAQDESVKYDFSHRKKIVPITENENNPNSNEQHAKLHHSDKQPSWRDSDSQNADSQIDESPSIISESDQLNDRLASDNKDSPSFDDKEKIEDSEVLEPKNNDDEESSAASTSETSGNNEVDELASAAVEKREAKQRAEQEAAEKSELEAMIVSKDYYVPIATERSSRLYVVTTIIIVAAVAVSIVAFMVITQAI